MNNVSIKDWIVFIGVCSMAAICFLDSSITTLAVAPIARYFEATLDQMQWIVSIYFLTSVSLIIFFAKLSAIFGKKRLYQMGIILMTLGSLTAAVAWNEPVLFIGRILQGIGLASGTAFGLLIISETFPEEKRGWVIGLYMSVIGIAQTIGPTTGGVLIHYFTWRSIFLINIPLGLIAFICILPYKDLTEHKKAPLDFLGFILAFITISLFSTAVNQINAWGYDSWKFISCLAFSFLAALLFLVREKKTDHPLIHLSLFKHRTFMLVLISRCFFLTTWVAIYFFISLYLQNILGHSSILTGFLLMFPTLGFAITSPVIGRWTDKIGFKKPLIITAILLTITFSLLLAIDLPFYLYTITIGLVMLGITCGFSAPSSAGLILKSLPVEHKHLGIGMLYTGSMLSMGIGIAASGALFDFISRQRLTYYLSHFQPSLSSLQINILERAVTGTRSYQQVASSFSKNQMPHLWSIVHDSFLHGLIAIIGACVIIGVVTLVMSFYIEE